MADEYLHKSERLNFKWDPAKNEANIKKHKISFEEATFAFYDDNALYDDDPVHSVDEKRFLVIGLNKKLKLLTVCHCYKENDTIIRIISAREANFNEKILYGEQF